MTHSQRISNLKSFGYNDREAEFLVAAALHSGYFLARQYLAMAGVESGYADASLVKLTQALNHAKVLRGARPSPRLYSIFSRPLYAALGIEHSRNRRDHTPLEIRRRVMTLDYVVDQGKTPLVWLRTEEERLDYFERERGIARTLFPRKVYVSSKTGAAVVKTTRYFIDKTPVCATADGTVRFVLIDPGYHSEDPIESFIDDYGPIVTALKNVEIVYASTVTFRFKKAEAILRRSFANSSSGSVDPGRIALFVELDKRAKADGVGGFTLDEIRSLNEFRRAGFRVESDVVLDRNTEEKSTTGVSFSTWLFSQNYDLFDVVTHGPGAKKLQRHVDCTALYV